MKFTHTSFTSPGTTTNPSSSSLPSKFEELGSASISMSKTHSSLTSASTIDSGTDASAGQTSPQETGNKANNRIEPGAVAGIAIGCLFAGIFVGICFAWLLQRFTKRRPRHRRAIRIVRAPKNPDTDSPGSMESSDNKIKVENFILQATPDREVVGMLQRLEVIMEQHIENYYHVKPIDIGVSVLAEQLTNLGISQDSSGFGAEAVAKCIDCNSRNGISLLPGPAINFLRSIRSIDKSRQDFNVMSVVLTKWRTLSALLLHPTPVRERPLRCPERAVRHQAEELVEELDPFLHCFVTPDQDNLQKQRHHMYSIIVEAAKLGYALFSHTGDWRFIYKDMDTEIFFRKATLTYHSYAAEKVLDNLNTIPRTGVLRVTYQLITLAIESGQVSDEVRRSLELVRTCERDLQHLVGLREEYLDILERKPIELDRVNTIIRAAHQGLAEVCKIVEKCRPEANQGRIPFKRRSRWIFLDSTDFYTQIPVIALQAPVPVPDQVQSEKVGLSRKKSVGIDNIALLGNIMGGKAASRRYSTQGNRDMVPDSAPNDNNAQPGQPFHSSAPPPYRAADNVQSSTSQRSWTSTPEASDTRRPDALRAHYMTHFGTLLSEDLQALIQILFINPGPLIRYHRHVKISIT
ncbi:hypothetical protein QL093DRAFT_2562496 [Fusarium oxysporum]|nr:hypothetical protein QL093DRAFT_2562496 [Fusarium oxysporum]